MSPRPLSLLLSLSLFSISLAPHSLAQSKAIVACEQKVERAKDSFRQEYVKDLQQLMEDFRQDGDLESYLKVRDEIDRFNKTLAFQLRQGNNTANDLISMKKRGKNKLYEEVLWVIEEHIEGIEDEIKELTIKNQISEAESLFEDVKTLKRKYSGFFRWKELQKESNADGERLIDTVTVKEVNNSYTKNPQRADERFLDQTMRIKGIVKSFEQSLTDRQFIHLTLIDEEDPELEVLCKISLSTVKAEIRNPGPTGYLLLTDKSKTPKSHKIRYAEMITLEGQGAKKHIQCTIKNVYVPNDQWGIKDSEENLKLITPKDIYQAYKRNPERADKLYLNKRVQVKGVVTKFSQSLANNQMIDIFLSSPDDSSAVVKCQLPITNFRVKFSPPGPTAFVEFIFKDENTTDNKTIKNYRVSKGKSLVIEGVGGGKHIDCMISHAMIPDRELTFEEKK